MYPAQWALYLWGAIYFQYFLSFILERMERIFVLNTE